VSAEPRRTRPSWTFLTNHGHVLLAVARDPDVKVSDIAATVGITSRAALMVLHDLEEAGYLTRERVGRRTHYTIEEHRPFRHPAAADHEVDELLAIFAQDAPVRAAGG
jgi:predicted ArsR family transcriptional regulator